MAIYDNKPERFLERVHTAGTPEARQIYCAGFEFKKWRCIPLSHHLVEWLPDYALPEAELLVNHGNIYIKLRQAAVRVYTSEKYERRGEAGEIALHAICREFFETVPISPRVFYKSASNDPIKSFDMVHARFPRDAPFEIWLGESKLYTDPLRAIADAISSIESHIAEGFLTSEKLLLGPQIPSSTPHYKEISALFKSQTSADKFLEAAVFVVGILCTSKSAKTASTADANYLANIENELGVLELKLDASGLRQKIRMLLIYVPLADKSALVDEFDKRLKGLQ